MTKLSFQYQEDVLHAYDEEAYNFLQGVAQNEVLIAEIKRVSAKELRSIEQNRMQFRWYRDMEKQGDQTAEEYRAYCKAWFGVPLLIQDDEDFREVYNSVIRPLQYEDKLKLMGGAIDLPVTSRMSVETMAKYLKAVSDYGLEQGFRLTTFEHLFEWLKEDTA